MAKRKRSLEYRGAYETPVDNTYIQKPNVGIETQEVPNLRYPNSGFFYNGVGLNMYGDWINYNNGKRITEQEAKDIVKKNFKNREQRINDYKDDLLKINLYDYFYRNK